eukprot:CCRYP_014690-RA/>CCRYP_014690-RA protein AED:0.13 eAED:0.13 QI:0/-1/0/1/-1/1/1/0/568
MKFFSGATAKNKMPPTTAAVPNAPSNTTAAPTLEELSNTLWRSTLESDEAGSAAVKPTRSKYDKVSRRSSTESVPTQHPHGTSRSIDHRTQSQSDREKLDASKTSRQEPFRRSGNADPIGKAASTTSGGQRTKHDDKKELHHVTSTSGLTSKDKERKKKRQQDAPEGGDINGALGFVANSMGTGEEQQSIKEKSFQDVLKNVKVSKTLPVTGLNNENNPFVVRSAPEHKSQVDNSGYNTKLNLPGFKSTPNQPTSALESLLASTQNISSDCSISTLNTTTQCAYSLGRIIEDMRVEFQKLKNQKNKAESYAEKLHTDYVRMQEGLEREYEKVCYERDELKVAREKDYMAIDKLKEELKALKAEHAALKELTTVGEEKRRAAEEENGRMKIALEALLVRSGALKKDDVRPGHEEGVASHDKNDRRREPSNESHSFSSLPKTSDRLLRRQSSSSSRPVSLSCSPEVLPSRHSLCYPQSADSIKPSMEFMSRTSHGDAVRLPFDSYGNRRTSIKKRLPPFNTKQGFDDYQRNSTLSTEPSSPYSNKDEDNESIVSNHTNDDTLDGTADSPL